MKPKVIVADDEPRIRKMLSLLLEEDGFDVKNVSNGKEVLELLPNYKPDLILLDQQMPFLNGIETLEKIKETYPQQVVIFISAYGSVSLAVDAVKKGAYDFIEKPFDNDNLLLTVHRAIDHNRLKKEVFHLQQRLKDNDSEIIGKEGGLKKVMEKLQRVARTDATVLIYGESGTGKELIAKSIHKNSLRKKKPFVAINCGAIPLSLLESELFGHEKGAFTDAKNSHIGTFEQANGGTLFLDEIGELPLEAQVKFLRVLESREITRIGGKTAIPVDVRIIAATNRKLEEEVNSGKFRLDLLYRLNIFTLELPPLRERKSDIPLLIHYFIRKYNNTLGLSVDKISPEAMQLMTEFDFPGNIRDLENALQSAMILASDNCILPEHLPSRLFSPTNQKQVLYQEAVTEENSLKELSAQTEKEKILATLHQFNFSRTLTAEALDISRKTLFNKMKKYNIGNF